MHFTAVGSLKDNVPCRLSRSQHVLPVLQYESTDAGVPVTVLCLWSSDRLQQHAENPSGEPCYRDWLLGFW